MNVYEKRPIEECFEKTRKSPIKMKWVDNHKGDRQNVNVRSRLVAKQINTGTEDGLLAATPPLEALRILLSATVTGNKPKALMFNDISRAYMHARTTSDIFVVETSMGAEDLFGVQPRQSVPMRALALAARHQSTRARRRLRVIR